MKELADYIDKYILECSEYIQDPSFLVGRHISHRFEVDDSDKLEWYNGTVVSYNAVSKTHEIEYEGEGRTL